MSGSRKLRAIPSDPMADLAFRSAESLGAELPPRDVGKSKVDDAAPPPPKNKPKNKPKEDDEKGDDRSNKPLSASAARKVGTLEEPFERGDRVRTIRISFSIFEEADSKLRQHMARYPYVSRNDFVSLAILEKLERFEKEKALGSTPTQPLRRATRARNHEEKRQG